MNELVKLDQGNRRIGIALALFAAAVFVSVIIRRWMDSGL